MEKDEATADGVPVLKTFTLALNYGGIYYPKNFGMTQRQITIILLKNLFKDFLIKLSSVVGCGVASHDLFEYFKELA